MPPSEVLLLALLAFLTAQATRALAVNYYILPVGDNRCRGASNRLRCLDQSVLLAATDTPDESLLDSFLLCNSSWSALGCQQEDVGGVAWRLAFRLTAVPCGQRFVFADSAVNPLLRPVWWGGGGAASSLASSADEAPALTESGEAAAATAPVAEFTCRSHRYPHVHRPRHRFTHLVWHRDSPPAFPVNISAHVYAHFRRSSLSPTEQAAECVWRGGFWCSGRPRKQQQQQQQTPPQAAIENESDGNGNSSSGGGPAWPCIYGTHRCNGQDDCMDDSVENLSNNSTSSSISTDELDCGTGGLSGLFDTPTKSTSRLQLPTVAWLFGLPFIIYSASCLFVPYAESLRYA